MVVDNHTSLTKKKPPDIAKIGKIAVGIAVTVTIAYLIYSAINGDFNESFSFITDLFDMSSIGCVPDDDVVQTNLCLCGTQSCGPGSDNGTYCWNDGTCNTTNRTQCANSYCNDNGTASGMQGECSCICHATHTGDTCETELTQCTLDDVQGKTCNSEGTVKGYHNGTNQSTNCTCECNNGYSGTNCQTHADSDSDSDEEVDANACPGMPTDGAGCTAWDTDTVKYQSAPWLCTDLDGNDCTACYPECEEEGEELVCQPNGRAKCAIPSNLNCEEDQQNLDGNCMCRLGLYWKADIKTSAFGGSGKELGGTCCSNTTDKACKSLIWYVCYAPNTESCCEGVGVITATETCCGDWKCQTNSQECLTDPSTQVQSCCKTDSVCKRKSADGTTYINECCPGGQICVKGHDNNDPELGYCDWGCGFKPECATTDADGNITQCTDADISQLNNDIVGEADFNPLDETTWPLSQNTDGNAVCSGSYQCFNNYDEETSSCFDAAKQCQFKFDTIEFSPSLKNTFRPSRCTSSSANAKYECESNVQTYDDKNAFVCNDIYGTKYWHQPFTAGAGSNEYTMDWSMMFATDNVKCNNDICVTKMYTNEQKVGGVKTKRQVTKEDGTVVEEDQTIALTWDPSTQAFNADKTRVAAQTCTSTINCNALDSFTLPANDMESSDQSRVKPWHVACIHETNERPYDKTALEATHKINTNTRPSDLNDPPFRNECQPCNNVNSAHKCKFLQSGKWCANGSFDGVHCRAQGHTSACSNPTNFSSAKCFYTLNSDGMTNGTHYEYGSNDCKNLWGKQPNKRELLTDYTCPCNDSALMTIDQGGPYAWSYSPDQNSCSAFQYEAIWSVITHGNDSTHGSKKKYKITKAGESGDNNFQDGWKDRFLRNKDLGDGYRRPTPDGKIDDDNVCEWELVASEDYENVYYLKEAGHGWLATGTDSSHDHRAGMIWPSAPWYRVELKRAGGHEMGYHMYIKAGTTHLWAAGMTGGNWREGHQTQIHFTTSPPSKDLWLCFPTTDASTYN